MSLFRVYVDGSLFYHPHMSKLAITRAQIQEDAENIDSLTLSAPHNHPYLSSIRPLASTIVCKKGNAIVFLVAFGFVVAVLGHLLVAYAEKRRLQIGRASCRERVSPRV